MPPNKQPASPASRIRVFLVDDHPLLRHGIAESIGDEPDMEICGQAGSAAEAMPAIASSKPQVAIVDISLPGRDGIELVKDLKGHFPSILILVLSMHEESLYAERALRAGAAGYIMKSASTDTLIQAIRKARAGEIVVGRRLVNRMLTRIATGAQAADVAPLECLTNRELEILRLLGHCRLRREIAQELHLSVKTIESHQANMREKLGLGNIIQLRKFAAEFLCSEAAGRPCP
jgi:DNA-binding NarL/FixJ family response regulator